MALAPYATAGQKAAHWGLRVFGLLFCLYLAMPMVVLVPLSFNEQALFHYPIKSYSLKWYQDLVTSPEWAHALVNSLVVATGSTLLATVLGTAAAVGLWRARFPGKSALMIVIMTPMIVPSVVAGVSMYMAFARVGLANSYTGIILAHTALASPLVVITVSATLARFDARLLCASSSLGATPLTTFRRIMLPLIAPGAAAGAIFAFVLSFDELIAALFITGPDQRTLPVQMYTRATDLFDLTIASAATFMLAVAIAMMLLIELLKKKDRLAGDGRWATVKAGK